MVDVGRLFWVVFIGVPVVGTRWEPGALGFPRPLIEVLRIDGVARPGSLRTGSCVVRTHWLFRAYHLPWSGTGISEILSMAVT